MAAASSRSKKASLCTCNAKPISSSLLGVAKNAMMLSVYVTGNQIRTVKHMAIGYSRKGLQRNIISISVAKMTPNAGPASKSGSPAMRSNMSMRLCIATRWASPKHNRTNIGFAAVAGIGGPPPAPLVAGLDISAHAAKPTGVLASEQCASSLVLTKPVTPPVICNARDVRRKYCPAAGSLNKL